MPDIEVIEVLVHGLQGPAAVLTATSATSLAVGPGSKSLTVTPTAIQIVTGIRVRLVNDELDKVMDGDVTAWDEETGSLTLSVDYTEGSGSDDGWTVIAGVGPAGPASLFAGDASDVPTTEGGQWGGDDVETCLNALSEIFTGDSGSGGAEGLVPAPGAGDAAAAKFLKADGSWAVPAGGGGGTPGGSDTQVQYNDSAAFGGDASFAFNESTKVVSMQRAAIAQGTITDPATGLDISGTWNDASDTFTALNINMTNTASAAASSLINAQIGGVTKFNVARSGVVTSIGLTGEVPGIFSRISTDTASRAFVGIESNFATDTATIAFGPGGSTSRDTKIVREEAGVFSIVHANNAMALRIYRTYTGSGANYERMTMQTGSGYVEIVAETAGTGADDLDVRLTPAGAGLLRFGAHSSIGAETVTGYITIKDAGGTSRKLAVVS